MRPLILLIWEIGTAKLLILCRGCSQENERNAEGAGDGLWQTGGFVLQEAGWTTPI